MISKKNRTQLQQENIKIKNYGSVVETVPLYPEYVKETVSPNKLLLLTKTIVNPLCI